MAFLFVKFAKHFWPFILAIFSFGAIEVNSVLHTANLQSAIPNAALSSNRHSMAVPGTSSSFAGTVPSIPQYRHGSSKTYKIVAAANPRPYFTTKSENSKNHSASFMAASALYSDGMNNETLVQKLLEKKINEEKAKNEENAKDEIEKIKKMANNLIDALAECDRIKQLKPGQYWETLKIEPNDSMEERKKKAKYLVQLLHPDKYNLLLSVKGADDAVATVKDSLNRAFQLVDNAAKNLPSHKRTLSDGNQHNSYGILTKEELDEIEHMVKGRLTKEELERRIELLNKLKKRTPPRYDDDGRKKWKSDEENGGPKKKSPRKWDGGGDLGGI